MNKSILMLFLAGLGGASVSEAQAGALDEFRMFATQVRSAQGDFSQTQTLRNGKREVLVGRFSFARPGKFRWVYIKPFEQVLVSDGVNFFLYDKDLAQVTVRKVSDAIGTSPAALLFGSNDLEKHFRLSEDGVEQDASGEIQWLVATPLARDSQFERIRIGLRHGLPARMELRDALGKSTALEFRQLERNPALPPENFRFISARDAPGADVIEQ